MTGRRSAASLLGVLAVFGIAAADIGARPGAQDPQVTLAARAVQPGEVVRVDVTCRCESAPLRVRTPAGETALFGISSASEAGATRWQGLVGLDLETQAGAYPLAVYEPGRDAPSHTLDLRVVAKVFATRRLRVSPGFVEPLPADLPRIEQEATALEALFKSVTPRLWHGPFVTPVAARATSNFGTRSVFNGQPRAPHAGVDFSSAAGVSVVAPGAGRIVFAGELFFTGNTVIIDHGLGLFSLLAHLSVVTVRQNDIVERGMLVGRVGATGRATGPHLHWGVRLNGARVDPLSLLFATGRDERES
ncbi:MAG: M23 family metallopeptidase [Acidobacteria bacterium]|nr:M23 family metallopeptidase [Acidobacteriota bacterium]